MDWQALRDLAGQGYAPKALLDVGAHLGGFTSAFLDIFPECSPVLVEPNPHCAGALSKLPYESYCFAAGAENGDAELHLTSEWLQSTGASLYRENTQFFRDEVVQKVRVPCRRLDDVFSGRRFDVIKIDVQGAELDVLRGGRAIVSQADYVLTEVSLVDYNLGGAKAEDVFAELAGLGFGCTGILEFHRLKGVANGALLQMDFLFENRARKARAVQGPGVLDVAEQLSAMGRTGAAEIILRQAAGLCAPDPAALQALVRHELARGGVQPALELLLRLRTFGGGDPKFVSLLQSALTPAVERINAHMAAAQWEQAAKVAAPFAKLLPSFASAQTAAMTAAAAISDAQGAGEFARRLLELSPQDARAAKILRRSEIVAAANPLEREPARQALFPAPDRHALLTMRDLHDASNMILCGEIADADLPRLSHYMSEAADLVVDVPKEVDLPGWVNHFRVAMAAMNPSLFLEPLPQSPVIAPPALAMSSGEALTPGQFASHMSALNPTAVFFVAADERYIGLYANHYVESVVRHCDVRYAVVLHVIGGAGRLAEIASTLNHNGANILLTGDEFDAAAVTTKCYDTPPKCLLAHPAAHFQSARFQWLGWLLSAANKPVFVSDIDLLLQRGVADLLAREADSHIVLNENDSNMNAGSRLTANLLLLNPLPGAQFYANALKGYLDHALAQPEVSRWIDQYALLMARHRIRRERPDFKIGYFDTATDINNIMYRSFEKNPFRFLSLYHGFDMDSLKTAA
jgi:FkbM family methyltransferase